MSFQCLVFSLSKVSTLREEIDSKQTMIEELRDANQKLTLAQEKMIGDYDKLKKEEEEKSAKLADIAVANERREQAKQDLKGGFFLNCHFV